MRFKAHRHGHAPRHASQYKPGPVSAYSGLREEHPPGFGAPRRIFGREKLD